MSTIAKHVIKTCGGAQKVADLLGINVSSVHKWKYTKKKGGTDGIIPAPRQQDLLSKARANGVKLSPEDFFPGSSDGGHAGGAA